MSRLSEIRMLVGAGLGSVIGWFLAGAVGAVVAPVALLAIWAMRARG